LTGDACLSAPPDNVVADDVVPISVYIAVINARRMSQNDANTTGVGDCAILDDPVLPHPRTNGAHLQFQTRWRPVRGCVHKVKAIDGDVFKAGNFGHEEAFTNVDLGQLLVGIGIAEIRPDGRHLFVHPTKPTVLDLCYFLCCLFFVEGLAIEIDVPAMMPLTVVKPAAGDLQGVGIVLAEE